MKVETLESDSLNRKYKFSVPTQSIMEKVESELLERAKTFKMAGFREGKVPISMVRKQIGTKILSDVIEQTIDTILKEHLEKNTLRAATAPSVEIQSFSDASDLVFEAKIELMPDLPEMNWDNIKVELLEVSVGDEDITKAHSDILKNFKNYEKTEDNYAAQMGDALLIDFVGKVDEKEFEGSKGINARIELGAGQFIPGLEEQLVGAKSGETVFATLTLPADYPSKDLASKIAVFEVKINEVLKPNTIMQIDEDFAKSIGVESLEKLNELIKTKISTDFKGVARLRAKKQLFDLIDSQYQFSLPDSMVKVDFELMWKEIKKQYDSNKEAFNKPIEEVEEEYKKIARRRVKLGILIADVAKNHAITVSEDDLQHAARSEAMQRPGQEKMILDFYSNKNNLERLRGPILEEKTVDFIFTQVNLLKKSVTSKEFFEISAKDTSTSGSAA